MKLPEFGVRRPVTTMMIFLATVVLGLVSLSMLSVDLLPEIEPPAISVLTIYPGATASDVEDKVTRHIENQLSIVSNLDTITSISAEGQSIVTCTFQWGTDLNEAANDIRERLDIAKRLLPEDAEEPMLFKFSTANIPVLFVGFTADESYPRLYQFVDRFVADRLKTIPGVGAVQVLGGLQRQIQVRLKRERLEAYGLSPSQVAQAISSSHLDLPGGRLEVGRTEYLIRVLGEIQEPRAFGDIVVALRNGNPIYLRDVAEVVDTHKEQRMFVRVNGRPAVMLMVQKQSGANTVNVTRRVKDRLKELEPFFPEDVRYVILMDSGRDILISVKNLSQTLWWALITVSAVVLFFLHRTVASLIVVLTIPFSLIASLIFLYLFGMTINVISLSSLIIAMGMVVDNAIVVLDNIMRKRQEGIPPHEAAIEGASEVGLAITASSLTTIAIFVPLIFTKGITGIMFRDMALVVTVTILASLLTALTITPMLSSRLLSQGNPKWGRSIVAFAEGVIGRLEGAYGWLLDRALARPKLTVALAFGLLLLVLPLYSRIGSEFLPEEDRSYVGIDVELPVGTRVEETDEVVKRIEAIVREEVPELKTIFSRCGSEEESLARAFGSKMGSHIGHVGLTLVDKELRRRSAQEIAQRLRERISGLPGILRLNVGIEQPLGRMLFGGGKALTLELLGSDLDQLYAYALRVKERMEKVPGAVDVSVDFDPRRPEVHITLDRERVSSLGLNVETVARTIRSLFYGYEAAQFLEGGNEYEIFLQLPPEQRATLKDLQDLPIPLPSGGYTTLGNIGRIEVGRGPVEIYHKDQMRMIRVEANVRGRAMGDVARDVEEALRELGRPEGITAQWGGQVREQQKAFRDLMVLFFLGVVLVYMVMASQFESLRHPFLIMFSVPFLFIGVFLALFLGGATISLVSLIGVVMLVGIVVNNGIVLVDYTNLLRRRGLGLLEAVQSAGRRRLRPVLMTALTTMGGVFPMITTKAEGSEAWRPLGLTVFGGLFSSTLITLLIVPTLYYLLERRRSP